MVNPTNVEIHQDIGLAWDAIDGTTTTIIDGLISRAQNKVKVLTGTTTGSNRDEVVRAISDAFAVQNAMAGLGPESVNLNVYTQMRDRFFDDANNTLRVMGYTLDGKYIRITQVNP